MTKKEVQNFSMGTANELRHHLGEMSLRKTLKIHSGTHSIVLAVPHDGYLIEVDNVPLRAFQTHVSNRILGDRFTRSFARTVSMHCQKNYDLKPYIIMQRVARTHRTFEIQRYFESVVANLLNALAERDNGALLLLDIHGFKQREETGPHEIILGTAHRKSMYGSSADIQLATVLREYDFSVYLPTNQVQPNEVFTGEVQTDQLIVPITQALIRQGVQFPAIQVEVADSIRFNKTRRGHLVNALGKFISSCVKNSTRQELPHPISE